ncbi:MAG: CBS domain-containing protein [Deltaproteobacteria bacterium]|nr:CBS domain-containing protein [Deltaproteobacteria bacterium]
MVAANMMSAGVRTIGTDETVPGALRLFTEGHKVLVSVDSKGVVTGAVTPGSLMEAFPSGKFDNANAPDSVSKALVKESAEKGFATVRPHAGMDEVRAAFARPRDAGFVVVTDDCGRPLGVIFPEDVLRRIWRYATTR